jgi:hypothetical protein
VNAILNSKGVYLNTIDSYIVDSSSEEENVIELNVKKLKNSSFMENTYDN